MDAAKVMPSGKLFESGANIWSVCECVEPVLEPRLEPGESRITAVGQDVKVHQHFSKVFDVSARG
ncbi:hypothetical protein R3P93_20775 [Rhodococcus cerastii]|uniref:Uncharacterized protein n=1 Tax=Rhodococcus cerastii TaxID=908616 RepID=A0ABU4D5Q1_9NOCA|nr:MULTISPECIES: hypothetical protein [Rhodococcus]MDV6305005.1 hypothetical protein [Rhodococcus cerastii]